MKNRLLTIVLAFLPLMSWGQGTTDPQPYARLAEDGNNNLVLTFYYNLDKNDSDFGIGPFTSASDRGWHSSRANIKEVVFDESFASYDGLSSMNVWFYQMSGLTKVTGISNLNTANVTSLRSTFNGCSSLTTLDLSSLNTSEVKEMNFMFDGCSSLTDLKVGFSTENVTTMANMFLGCSSLTTLDLSTFNTANVKSNMDYMFSSCSALTTIYVSDLWTTENVTSGNEMFNACQSLVGGQGTTFSTSHRGLDYAHIDGGTANPGYFTEKNAAPYVNPEPYVVLTDSNTVLTFYYDDQKEARGGIAFLDGTNVYWPSSITSVTQAVFDSSFADFSPTSTAYWFNGLSGLTIVTGLEYLNTEHVTTMEGMFEDCSGLTSLDVSGFKTANVTNMRYVFMNCSGLTTIDLSSFNTSNVTDMNRMFLGCSGLTSLDLSGFNTDNVTDMGLFFSGCSSLTSLNVSGFNTANVTDMNGLFAGCFSLTSLDVSGFNTANVTDMNRMFADCSGLTTLNLSAFNTTNVTNMSGMFSGACFNLKTIYVGSDWSTALVSSSDLMFFGCTNLVGGMGTVYNPDHIDASYAHIDGGTSNPGYFTDKNAAPYVDPEPYVVLTDSNTVLTFYYDDQKTARAGIDINSSYLGNSPSPYGTATSAVFDASFANYYPTSTAYWFQNCSALTSISGIDNLKTDNVTDMNMMFEGCSSLTSLDVSGFNTANVTDMSWMFWGCSGLTSLDVSGFNTDKVEDMGGMFDNCSSLTSLDVSGLNTANVTGMNSMFANCSSLMSLDVSGFNTSNVTDMSRMFEGCSSLTSLDVSGFNTANVTDMSRMFEGCSSLTSLDVSGFNTSNVTNMSWMFRGCTGLTAVDVSGFNTDKVEYMHGMFWGCSGLTSLDVTGFKTGNVTSMYCMFRGCTGLTAVDVSGFNTDKVEDMGGMFVDCSSLTSLDVSGLNTANVTNMSEMFRGCSALTSLDVTGFKTDNVEYMSEMFHGCSGLTNLDVSGFKTDNVTRMDYMFQFCSGLTSLDVSGFNTSNVTSMSSMFESCSGLTSLDVSSFNTANVTSMYFMFWGCSGLTSLDVSGFNTANVTDMIWMFWGCSGLTSLDVSGFNTDKVEDMRGMFAYCSSLTSLDVSGFNTSNVTNMSSMFESCSGLTSLDVSSFNTSNVTNMSWMFEDCSGLKTIYVGDNWSMASVTESNEMFSGCTNLVGGMGTVYNPDHVDAFYAHVDGGTSNPGYFTLSGDGPYVPVDVTFDNHGVLTVGGTATMAEALEAVGGTNVVAETITAVVWNSTATLTNSDLQDLDNPNMLVYVPSEMQAPVNRDNVIIGNDSTGYTAKNIVLTDVESGNQNFYCPKAFVAEMITYAHDYLQQTEVGVSRGWETIALPFTVQTIMHEKQGVIAPFGNDASNKHFWLRQLMMQGLTRATVIEANMPYLIAMPNSDAYAAEFNLNGRVTFSSQNVEVPQTQMNVMEAHDANDNMMMFVPCFQAQPQGQEIYALNVGEQRDNHPEGSVFEANYREVRPFEAFTVHNGNGPAPRFVLISEMMGGATEIEDVRSKMSDGRGDNWYDMNGRKLQKEPTRKGVYLNNGRKVVVQK